MVIGEKKVERSPTQKSVKGTITCRATDMDGTITSTRLRLVRWDWQFPNSRMFSIVSGNLTLFPLLVSYMYIVIAMNYNCMWFYGFYVVNNTGFLILQPKRRSHLPQAERQHLPGHLQEVWQLRVQMCGQRQWDAHWLFHHDCNCGRSQR